MSYTRRLVWYLLAGTRGGENRARIVKALRERPCNANQLADILRLDYKTVRHHLNVLVENKVVVVSRHGEYGAVYILSEFMEKEFDTFDDVWSKIG